MMKSRINLAVNKKFKDNGIMMPFPQMEISVKTGTSIRE